MIEPLSLSFEVECSVSHAFRVWTEKVDTWWPADHTFSGQRDATVVLERHVGGRIYERTADGEEYEWGEITAWDPPSGFGYLWHLRSVREDATDVAISFVETGPDATRVDIVHSGWERLGDRGPGWQQANLGGWSTLLPHFVSAAEAAG